MLLSLPAWRRRGVRRLGNASWEAIDDDPQFIFKPRYLGARWLAIELSDSDRLLDPRFYVDRGTGLSEDEQIDLRPTRHGFYLVDLRSFGSVRSIRFDPASHPARFRLRAHCAWRKADITSLMGKRLRAGSGIDCETVSGQDAAGLSVFKTRTYRDAAKHFDQVVALAGIHFANGAPAADAPLISFVTPLYNTPPAYLDALVQSFRGQAPWPYELIFSDDGSTSQETLDWLASHAGDPDLTILRKAANEGMAVTSNRGISVARGAWVSFIDHDDALAPFAIARLHEAMRDHPHARFLYTDEVVADAKLKPSAYMLKPAYDPVLLSGVNYINHLSVFRADRLRAIGGFRKDFDGSQDYDLLIRYLEGAARAEVVHVPYPAYLWRRDGSSYSVTFLDKATRNARRALAEAYTRGSQSTEIAPALDPNLHRVRFDLARDHWPKISVVIPNRNAFAHISRVIADLTQRTDYPNIEIIVIDNGSTDEQVLALYAKTGAEHPGFRADILVEPFNFARQTNRGLRMATGDLVLLLNNDVEIVDAGWLKEMASCFDYPDVGIVGARLLYPNGSIQHAGVIVGLGSVAGHWFCGAPEREPGPMARLRVRQSMSAVTGACMLVSRTCLEATGVLDDVNFAIAYNDIDFCMRAMQQGFRIVWTPFATLVHHESATRGSDETAENIERFTREKAALREKYGLLTYVDPAFSPWYNRGGGKLAYSMPDELPRSRLFEP